MKQQRSVISQISVGTMRLFEKTFDESAVRSVLRSAVNYGVRLFDTADVYAPNNRSEQYLSHALRRLSPGRRLTIATKGGMTRIGDKWAVDGTPRHLRRACEASLRALRCDSVELYFLHAPDPDVPFPESLGVLSDLRNEGKIKNIGLSNVYRSHIELALSLIPVAGIQNSCSFFDTSVFHNNVLDVCESKDIPFFAYRPLGGPRMARWLGRNGRFLKMADKYHATPQQIALSWLMSQSSVLVPVVGVSSLESARSSALATRIHISNSDISKLNELCGLHF